MRGKGYSAAAMRQSLYRYSGILFAIATAFGLGAQTTLAKLFYADGGSALGVMLARFVASTLVFGTVLLLRGRGFTVAPGLRLPLAAIGFIWSGAMIGYLKSVETISVSLGVMLLYLYPLLVLLYSALRGLLRPTPGLIALFVTAFAGLCLALADGSLEAQTGGVILAFLASCGAAFTFLAGARVAPAMSPLLMTFWINLAGLLLLLPLLPGEISLPSTVQAIIALALATLFYLVAILSQFQALARLPAARAAFLLNLEPVISILLASLVLGEVLTLLQACGITLVIAAVILSLRFRPAQA